MSTPYRLAYLPLFWSDLEQSVLYVRDILKAPLAAERLLDDVERGIKQQVAHPLSAAVYPSGKTRSLPYFWFPVGNYMVFYVVDGDVMEVRRFLYGARDLTKLL
ncbi:MAG: type II toxin-antitoxin system RelE/ParE family toxin [Raoultibacter sp.]